MQVDPETGLVVASCANGVCIVDLDRRSVVARVDTQSSYGAKVSNVLLANGTAFWTGDAGVWAVPLRPYRPEL